MATVSAAVFFISAAVLALELVLMRVLSIASWHHCSTMVISVALLGFGAGGVALTVCDRWLRPRWRTVVWLLCLGFAAAVPVCHGLAARVPLNVLELLWDPWQSAYLVATYLVLFVPFLLGGAAVGLCLVANAAQANRLYFFNLLGSGVGAAGAVLLMVGNPPVRLLLVVALTGVLASVALVARRRGWRAGVSLATGVALVVVFGLVSPLRQPVSPFKALPQFQASLGARHEGTRYSPLGRLDVIASEAIHLAPGLSLSFEGTLPPQKVLLTDGHSAAVIPMVRSRADAAYLDHVTGALAYHLLARPRVCIIGAGAGGDLMQALYRDAPARHVTAVELNGQVIELVRAVSPQVAALYDHPDVTLRVAEARFFLESTAERFDLIQISLLDSFTASSAGLTSLNESHLYTVEAIEAALGRLRPGGILSITRWLRTPPRDTPKMLGTLVEAMRRRGGSPPRERLAMIRGMYTATILAGADALTQAQRRTIRDFARQRHFDLVYLSDLYPEEANQYHRLPEPSYFLLARDLVDGDGAAARRAYPYDIDPATDDRPFFFDFFRWRSPGDLMRRYPAQWKAFVEWGYLVLAASLVQTVAVSGVLILLPAWFLRRRAGAGQGRWRVAAYFALLGFAYIFLEMGFITRMTLLLGNPIYATAVVLAAFLVASGLGSLSGARWFGRPEQAIPRAVAGIIVCATVVVVLMTLGFGSLVRLPFAGRMAAALAMTGSVAFFMGLPFPSGLRLVDRGARPLVPWAWAVNGFASVVGAVGGTTLAMSIGFSTLVAVAIGLYVLAALVGPRLARHAG